MNEMTERRILFQPSASRPSPPPSKDASPDAPSKRTGSSLLGAMNAEQYHHNLIEFVGKLKQQVETSNEQIKELKKTAETKDKELTELREKVSVTNTLHKQLKERDEQIHELSKSDALIAELKQRIQQLEESLLKMTEERDQLAAGYRKEVVEATKEQYRKRKARLFSKINKQDEEELEQAGLSDLQKAMSPKKDNKQKTSRYSEFIYSSQSSVQPDIQIEANQAQLSEWSSSSNQSSQSAEGTQEVPIKPNDWKCSFCSNVFFRFVDRLQHYPKCAELILHYEKIKDQYAVHKQNADDEDKKLIQTLLGWKGNPLNGISQAANIGAREVVIDEKVLELYKELHSKDYFKYLCDELIVGPLADRDGNSVYAQYTTKALLKQSLENKTNKRSKVVKEIIRNIKLDVGVPLKLGERREHQITRTKQILKQYQSDILHIKEWLNFFKTHKTDKPFCKVEGMFCDGIILPRLRKLFPKYVDFEIYLRKRKLSVQKVCPASVKGCVYVRLEDNANRFSQELVDALNGMINDLRIKFQKSPSLVPNDKVNIESQDSEEEDEVEENEVSNSEEIYIRQIDYTQDVNGFFLSFAVQKDLKLLAKLLDMRVATRDEYKSFESCLYLLQDGSYGSQEHPDSKKQHRFKIYNKLLHLLQSEQAKKKISMNLKALLLSSNSFSQKLLECQDTGISRLEFSNYFYSQKEQIDGMKTEEYQQRIDNALEKINQGMSANYHVSFKALWKSFWSQCKSIFIFGEDTWTVVYAKNPISTYTGQQVLVKHNQKGRIDFIKRFALPEGKSLVFDVKSGTLNVVYKKGKWMQLPIQSLNKSHDQKFDFELGDFFKYSLTKEDLAEIELTSEDGAQFQFEDAPEVKRQNKKRPFYLTAKSKRRKPHEVGMFGFAEELNEDIYDEGLGAQLDTIAKRDEKSQKKAETKERKQKLVEKIEVEVRGKTTIFYEGKVFIWKGTNVDGSSRFNVKTGQCGYRILKKDKQYFKSL